MSEFPTASRTFTVIPGTSNTQVGGASPVPVAFKNRTAKATGVSIALKDISANFTTTEGAQVFNSAYIGSADEDAPIQRGDFLKDETPIGTDKSGNPAYAYFMVKDAHPTGLLLKLHLIATEVQ